MNPEQAHRILSEPKYVVTMLEQTIKDLGVQIIDPPPSNGVSRAPLNALNIAELRGVVRGIRIAQGLFKEAQHVLLAQDEEAKQPKETEVPHVPPALAAAHLHPNPSEGASRGD